MVAAIYLLNRYPTLRTLPEFSKVHVEVLITRTSVMSHHAIWAKGTTASSTLRRVHFHVYNTLFAILSRTQSNHWIVNCLTPELLFSEPIFHLVIQKQVGRRIGCQLLRTTIFRTENVFPAVNFVRGIFNHAVPTKLVETSSNRNHVFI